MLLFLRTNTNSYTHGENGNSIRAPDNLTEEQWRVSGRLPISKTSVHRLRRNTHHTPNQHHHCSANTHYLIRMKLSRPCLQLSTPKECEQKLNEGSFFCLVLFPFKNVFPHSEREVIWGQQSLAVFVWYDSQRAANAGWNCLLSP